MRWEVLPARMHGGLARPLVSCTSTACAPAGFPLGLCGQDVDEAELSAEEAKERKIMKLLLKVKNGTPPQRKSALR